MTLPIQTDDGSAPGADFYTLFLGTEALSNHETSASAMADLVALAKTRPGCSATIRWSRTSDGTRWVSKGRAHGRAFAAFEYVQDRGRVVHVY